MYGTFPASTNNGPIGTVFFHILPGLEQSPAYYLVPDGPRPTRLKFFNHPSTVSHSQGVYP